MKSTKAFKTASTWERLQLEIECEDLIKAKMVREKGYPNMFGARIPVKSKWNLTLLEELLQGYEDKQVIEGLKYG